MEYVFYGLLAVAFIAFVVLVIRSYRKKLASGCCGAGRGWAWRFAAGEHPVLCMRAVAAGDGCSVQCQALPHQGYRVSGRTVGVHQQCHPPAAGLVFRNGGLSAAGHHRAGLLAGRRVSHGHQALCRIPYDR